MSSLTVKDITAWPSTLEYLRTYSGRGLFRDSDRRPPPRRSNPACFSPSLRELAHLGLSFDFQHTLPDHFISKNTLIPN